MQLPERRKLFQQRRQRREEVEAQLRRAQIESTSSEDEESFEDVSDDEVVNEGESEEVLNEDESEEEEVVNEDESEEEEVVNEDESEEEEVVNEDESEEEMVDEDESEEEADESEKIDDESEKEENNMSFSEKSLANSSDSLNNSNNLSLNKIKLVDDIQLSVVHDESNETLQSNTVLAKNNVLMNKNNSDDDEKTQSLYGSNFNMNDRQNRVVEWMVARESEKPYGGIIATDMGTTDCKVTILMNLLSKSKLSNSVNTQSEGETDLDETTVSSKGCTLILCPRSSIDHWFDRMNEKKNQGSLNVWLHYGRNRDNISLQDLIQKDVVITTVTLVLTGFRNKVNNPIYQIKWNRIILDDIKLYNYKQQTSKALCQLSGTCHWVFSGPTIIDNNDDEAIYSLIKFINYKPLNILENWKKWIKVNQTVSMNEKLAHLYYKKKIV